MLWVFVLRDFFLLLILMIGLPYNYEGDSICKEIALITPPTHALELNTIYGMNEKASTFRMVHKTEFYRSYLSSYRHLSKVLLYTLDIFSSGSKRNILSKKSSAQMGFRVNPVLARNSCILCYISLFKEIILQQMHSKLKSNVPLRN